MSWSLNLMIKFCLVLILVPFGADLKRSDGSDKGNHDGPEHVPVLSVRNPEDHGLGLTDISTEFGSDSEDDDDEGPNVLPELPNLVFIGCYDVWEKSNYPLSDLVNHLNSLEECARQCRRVNNLVVEESREDYLIGVRGQSCICPYVANFRRVRIADAYCPIPCPDISSKTCGGNYSFSAYCLLGGSKECSEYNNVPIINLYNQTLPPREPPGQLGTMNNIAITVDKRKRTRDETPICANCSNCRGVLRPSFDYIPDNSPELCARFCRRRITYFRDSEPRVREPTDYALLGWYDGSAVVPACSCANSLEDLVDQVEDSYCDKKCPGGQKCGSVINKFMVNVYPTDRSLEQPEEEVETTTATKPEDDEDDSSEEEEDPTDPHGKCGGEPQCTGTDPYDIPWTACPDEVHEQGCPNGASGHASWKCLTNGQFEGRTPVYSNCKTAWIKSMQGELEGPIPDATAIEFLTRIQDTCVKAENLENREAQYFGHEISSILNMAERVVKHVDLTVESDVLEFERLTETVAHIGSSILTNTRTWKQLSAINSSQSATDLLWTLEESSFELTERVANESIGDPHPSYNRTFKSGNISLASGIVGLEAVGNGTLTFSDEGSWIVLPPGWTSVLPTLDIAQYVGMAIVAGNSKDVTPFPTNISGLDGAEKGLNGKIMSFSLTRPSENNSSIHFPDIGAGVDIRIHHQVHAWGNGKIGNILRRKLHFGEERKAILGTAVCVYWDTTIGIWSEEGCTLIESDGKATRCECTHLTSFAVLFSYYDYVGKSLGLEVLTVVLCSLSVISLFATIFIFTVVRTTHGPRTTITKNLAFCLLISNTLILLVVDRHYFDMTEHVCIGAGILTHYAFLCAFMWMAIEGYHLYKMMIHVFDSGNSHMTFIRILAYGLPLIIILITGVIGALRSETAYGGEQFCWLNGKYILAFLVPVVIVVCGNLIVLFITLRTAYQVQSSPGNSSQERKKSNRTWVRGCFSITILLGITWIFGYLEMINNSIASEVGAYIFTILNGSQGFLIFVFHCLMNDKVKGAAERRNIRYPSWLLSPSSTNATSSGGPSGSNGNSRFGKQNMKSFYSDSITVGKGERKFGGGGPIDSFGNRRIQNPLPTKSQSVSNLNNVNGGSGGWNGNRHGTVSSSSSIVSSGNETNGSERDLLPPNLHLRRGSRH